MPSPLVHTLLPSACLIQSRSHIRKLTRFEWIKLILLTIFLANLPDWDVIPASLFPSHWHEIHRSWGHNLWFAITYVWFGMKLFRRLFKEVFNRTQAFRISLIAVLSHFLLDGMAYANHAGHIPGIPIFFPFSNWEISVPFKIFLCPEKSPELHPFLALATDPSFWSTTIFNEIWGTLILSLVWWMGLRLFSTYGRLVVKRPQKL